MCLHDLFLEDLNLLRNVLTAASVRSSRAITTSLRDASLPVATKWSVHTQIMLVTLTVVSTHGAICVAPEERVEEVACEGLCAHLVITSIQINWFLQAECMNSLKAFPLILNLLRVGEIAQRHATVVKRLATLLLFRAKLVEVGHGVGLRDLVFGKLIQV